MQNNCISVMFSIKCKSKKLKTWQINMKLHVHIGALINRMCEVSTIIIVLKKNRTEQTVMNSQQDHVTYLLPKYVCGLCMLFYKTSSIQLGHN